jgi:hypothetical protein
VAGCAPANRASVPRCRQGHCLGDRQDLRAKAARLECLAAEFFTWHREIRPRIVVELSRISDLDNAHGCFCRGICSGTSRGTAAELQGNLQTNCRRICEEIRGLRIMNGKFTLAGCEANRVSLSSPQPRRRRPEKTASRTAPRRTRPRPLSHNFLASRSLSSLTTMTPAELPASQHRACFSCLGIRLPPFVRRPSMSFAFGSSTHLARALLGLLRLHATGGILRVLSGHRIFQEDLFRSLNKDPTRAFPNRQSRVSQGRLRRMRNVLGRPPTGVGRRRRSCCCAQTQIR